MTILIADFDLFSTVGGGQSVYRSLIRKNPHINFVYLRKNEQEQTSRPGNAETIEYREKYVPIEFRNGAVHREWIISYVSAVNIAFSVRGRKFDAVDVPDYEKSAVFLRQALQAQAVEFNKLVLAMHGSVSTSLRMDWFEGGEADAKDEVSVEQEKLQFQAADVRYAISESYRDEWHKIVNMPIQYLNPLRFIDIPTPADYDAVSSLSPPDLNFIGRTEKRKGPDIFVQLAWFLPRSSYGEAHVIGSESVGPDGKSSSAYIKEMALARHVDIHIQPAKTPEELSRVFASKSITVLPSRYDSFNLLAIESLLHGCPTLVDTQCGVHRFIKNSLPNIPLIDLEAGDIYSCVPVLMHILQEYDEYRQRLKDALAQARIAPQESAMQDIYNSDSFSEAKAREELGDLFEKISQRSQLQAVAYGAERNIKALVPQDVKTTIRGRASKSAVKQLVKKGGHDPVTLGQMLRARQLPGALQQIDALPETTEADVSRKIEHLAAVTNRTYVARVHAWRELARLELLRGNKLVSATYRVRAMRLLGKDKFNDVSQVTEILEQSGYLREARATQALYSVHDEKQSFDESLQLLMKALADNRNYSPGDFEFTDDRREQREYRVSVIVSLYNAAAKLPLFLKALHQQTLARQGNLELVLVDSGSPDDCYTAFKQVAETYSFPVVYARTAKRETIQSAWNRGIALSRSPYLAFLGVDETVVPECYERLARELDLDPALDWVQGDSLVTDVSSTGVQLKDVMKYDRQGYRQHLVYLETCYLSWVGALYRRSIHDRFGFYDSTFTAAGDTEFKNRILPFIKTKSIPITLGLFWNYPDERTTHHPRAEVEDIRAWYLHRSVAGVKYAFQNTADALPELFKAALHYRKSYATHISSDVEYASNIQACLNSGYISNLPKMPDIALLSEGATQLLESYRFLDSVEARSSFRVLLQTRRKAAKVEKLHRAVLGWPSQSHYRIFNDNRHEQHNNIWQVSV